MQSAAQTQETEQAQDMHEQFTQFLLDCQALRFGSFTLKSGRISPYFINAGAFNTGDRIARLGAFYAQRIVEAQREGVLPERIDTIFGPAYKGIPLAVATAIALQRDFGMPVGYTFDRKERKDHGDGGMMVGTPLTDNMNVLMVDDVMTAGTAVREVVPKLRAEANIHLAGLVLSVDRGERAGDSELSAVASVEQEFGFPVLAITDVRHIFAAGKQLLDADGQPYVCEAIDQAAHEYLAHYGA